MNITALMLSGSAASNIGAKAAQAGIPSLFRILCDAWGFERAGTGYLILMVVGALLCMVSAYLIGSFNPAICFSKIIYHEEIRSYGSGNAGATNTLRVRGKKAGLIVFLGDAFKTIFKPKGSAGTGDPLDQRWTAGWKASGFTAAILQDLWMVRIEHGFSR